jgi:hypothetical protein
MVSLTCGTTQGSAKVSERHTYRLELSSFDLDVLGDVFADAIEQRLRRPCESSNLGDEITALKQIRALREIRSAIFAQEPVRIEAALDRTRLGLFGFARDAKAEEDDMATPTPFPLRGQAARMDALRAVLRPLDTGNMAIHELVAACENAVPEATIDEIADALRQVAAEHIAAAAQQQSRRSARAMLGEVS